MRVVVERIECATYYYTGHCSFTLRVYAAEVGVCWCGTFSALAQVRRAGGFSSMRVGWAETERVVTRQPTQVLFLLYLHVGFYLAILLSLTRYTTKHFRKYFSFF